MSLSTEPKRSSSTLANPCRGVLNATAFIVRAQTEANLKTSQDFESQDFESQGFESQDFESQDFESQGFDFGYDVVYVETKFFHHLGTIG